MSSTEVSAARTLLRGSLKKGLEWLLNEGWNFVRSRWLPALATLEAQASGAADRKLLAECSFMLGELWQLNDAPQAAIRAYDAALRHAPTAVEPWVEKARMLTALGRKKDSTEALRQAFALRPDLRDEIENSLFWDDRTFAAGSPTSRAAELLAEGKPDEALKALAGKATVQVRRWRACARGAAGDVDGVIEEWKGMARTRGTVLIEYADWFYIPVEAWARAAFWDALHALGERLDDEGIFPIDASLDNARGFSEAQKALLSFARRGAEARADAEKLREMVKWRPRWAEARESLRDVERRA